MSSDNHLAAAITEAARTMHQPQDLEASLATIADVARLSVPGFDHVGISTVDSRGQVHTRAATSDLVWTLDKVQYELGEGPCVDSLRRAHVVLAPDLRHDERWPRFVPRAVEEGVKSQLAVRLYLDDSGLLGGLNLYSTTSPDIHPEAEGLADLFAAHAAIALGSATDREQLNEALQSRKVIGQAIGIVMERYHISEDRAFQFLVRASSHGNIKMRDVAAELVREGNDKS
jgi:GAF domain-containing protein